MSEFKTHFKTVSVQEDKIPLTDFYKKFGDIEIYQSRFNTSRYSFFDEEYHRYRVIEYNGSNILDLDKNIEIYLQGYKDIPGFEKIKITKNG